MKERLDLKLKEEQKYNDKTMQEAAVFLEEVSLISSNYSPRDVV